MKNMFKASLKDIRNNNISKRRRVTSNVMVKNKKFIEIIEIIEN